MEMTRSAGELFAHLPHQHFLVAAEAAGARALRADHQGDVGHGRAAPYEIGREFGLSVVVGRGEMRVAPAVGMGVDRHDRHAGDPAAVGHVDQERGLENGRDAVAAFVGFVRHGSGVGDDPGPARGVVVGEPPVSAGL